MSVEPDFDRPGPQTWILQLEYDGSQFAGFQRQQGVPTVQAEIERALQIFFRQSLVVHPAGRTDSGVHASGQILHFQLPPTESKVGVQSAQKSVAVSEYRLCHALNAIMPPSIAIRRAAPAPADFHARFSCLAREYEYRICNSAWRGSLGLDYCLHERRPLDLDTLNAQARSLLGEQDFSALTRRLEPDESAMRYIDLAEFRPAADSLADRPDLIVFRIRGNAFLHNMIRIIVGTLLDLHKGKLRLPDLQAIINGRDRRLAGQTAPPGALFFRKAWYVSNPVLPAWLPQLDSYPWMRPHDNERIDN
ncbi:MAG: tRNA pseudouridine(38-40) synthase TruA [Leptospiraceae bacterium]|nr:tRNA pseudouridine(38-40) synthase TruA [Leptospiraceae bacterium]